MITIPIINIKANPLDALLAAVGLRLSMLAKGDNEAFLTLIKDKQVILQFTSDDGVARFFEFNNGAITQHEGTSDKADLTISFLDSTEGAKLLAKADTVTLMTAIQDGKMRAEGDYKLILWFASLARHIAKIPEEYQPYVDKAKPYLEQARPAAYKVGQLLRKGIGKIRHNLK